MEFKTVSDLLQTVGQWAFLAIAGWFAFEVRALARVVQALVVEMAVAKTRLDRLEKEG